MVRIDANDPQAKTYIEIYLIWIIFVTGGGGKPRGKSTSDSNELKIFCGNLSEQTTGDELRALFSKHGEVVEAFVPSGKIGFVKMDSEENCTAAIEALNGHSLHDHELKVEAPKSHEGKKVLKTHMRRIIL